MKLKLLAAAGGGPDPDGNEKLKDWAAAVGCDCKLLTGILGCEDVFWKIVPAGFTISPLSYAA